MQQAPGVDKFSGRIARDMDRFAGRSPVVKALQILTSSKALETIGRIPLIKDYPTALPYSRLHN